MNIKAGTNINSAVVCFLFCFLCVLAFAQNTNDIPEFKRTTKRSSATKLSTSVGLIVSTKIPDTEWFFTKLFVGI